MLHIHIPIYCSLHRKPRSISESELMSAPSNPSSRPAQVSTSLASTGTTISPAEAENIARCYYGLEGTARLLSGEKDSNFHFRTNHGAEFLLKVVNPGEDPEVTNMHTMALLHVASADPHLPVQRVLHAQDGSAELRLDFPEDGLRTVRTVAYAPGKLQRDTRPSSAQRHNIGAALAQLQIALSDFSHPAQDHELTWDLKHAGNLRSLLPAISDDADRELLEAQLDRFDEVVSPRFGSLRSQVVHNDLSGDNLLVDPDHEEVVAGIIDFGDMVKTPAVADLAVAAAYQLDDSDNPLDAALDVVRGFNEVKPLDEAEAGLLYDLILTRMVTRIAISEWRAKKFPENQKYILRNIPRAWAQFKRLSLLSRDEAADQIRQATAERTN